MSINKHVEIPILIINILYNEVIWECLDCQMYGLQRTIYKQSNKNTIWIVLYIF